MSSTSILSSGESEERWVHAMEKNFDQQHIAVDMPPPCVFIVPKFLSDEKPEAYAPTRLGLGPLHHLRPDLYASTNSHKLAAVTKLLPPAKLHHFRVGVVQALVEMEPVVRACYDQYLDLDIKTLAWILAIDGLYLFHILTNFPEMEHLAGDVLMLENQIPLVLLQKIFQVLQLSPSDDDTSLSGVQKFFTCHSPLELIDFELIDFVMFKFSNSVIENANYTHLLHQMYFLIVNNRAFLTREGPVPMAMAMAEPQLKDVFQGVLYLAERCLPGAGTAGQILSFVSAIPWEKISGMLKKDEEDSSTSAADEIDISSVSQMKTAGIRFIRTEGGIRDVRFDESEKKFYLPSITITATTEIVLRNLVAYEAATAKSGATLELAEYVDLMCGIIDSRRDVEILREANIVWSDLEDKEIARIFNGITKSEKKKTDKVSNVEKAVGDVNTRYNSLPLVKFKKSAEKYGYGCFKVASTVITIAVVVLLTLQAYCSVFGCGRWFGNDDVATLTHFML